MRFKLVFLCVIGLVNNAYSQTSTIALGKIEYEFKLLYLNQKPEDSLRYSKHSFELFFGNNSSIYLRKPAKNSVFFTKDTDTNGISKEILDKIKDRVIAPIKVRTGSAILKNYSKQILFTQEITQEEEKLIIKDTIERVDWIISNEKKVIAGYDAQKATGNFRGRIYDVWYTLEIPLNAGPWKLCGLPGLILEAKDTKNEVFFNVISIIIPPKIDFLIPNNFDGELISKQDFLKKNNELALKSQNMLRGMNKDNKVVMLGTTVKLELNR
jgi:GLPGLI family protein